MYVRTAFALGLPSRKIRFYVLYIYNGSWLYSTVAMRQNCSGVSHQTSTFVQLGYSVVRRQAAQRPPGPT